MLLYIMAFIVLSSLLTVFGYSGYAYLAIMLVLGFAWLWLCLKGFDIPNGSKEANLEWARKMFVWSLVVMVSLFVTIGVTAVA
jgi:protoheme IX farnesyltransferase